MTPRAHISTWFVVALAATLLPGGKCEDGADCGAGCPSPFSVRGTFNVVELPTSGLAAKVCLNAECNTASTEETLTEGESVVLNHVDGNYFWLRLTALSDRVVELTGNAYIEEVGGSVRLTVWQVPSGVVLLDYATSEKVRHYKVCGSPCAEVRVCFEPSAPDSQGLVRCPPE